MRRRHHYRFGALLLHPWLPKPMLVLLPKSDQELLRPGVTTARYTSVQSNAAPAPLSIRRATSTSLAAQTHAQRPGVTTTWSYYGTVHLGTEQCGAGTIIDLAPYFYILGCPNPCSYYYLRATRSYYDLELLRHGTPRYRAMRRRHHYRFGALLLHPWLPKPMLVLLPKGDQELLRPGVTTSRYTSVQSNAAPAPLSIWRPTSTSLAVHTHARFTASRATWSLPASCQSFLGVPHILN
ncbi:hypothetical protein J6590_064500 [Homalodisca vitripennis]|nr:hypothetical protein J6590_064500 [Homalodisca vitripennis]